MNCQEAELFLHAYLDGELDLTASLGIERHLESCATCSAEYQKLEMLRAEIANADLNFASDAVLQRIRAAVLPRRTSWRGPAWLAAAAAVLVLALLLPGRFATGRDTMDREVVDNHLRSLLADHLTDVPSSDRHTVKPWFQGKLDYAPKVPDLTAEGFVLLGGRLDVLEARKVAALVYKRREHIINLWIVPGNAGRDELEASNANGYHLMRWSNDGVTYRAVSDVDARELRAFVNAIRAH